jgi:hypothetical protein
MKKLVKNGKEDQNLAAFPAFVDSCLDPDAIYKAMKRDHKNRFTFYAHIFSGFGGPQKPDCLDSGPYGIDPPAG